MGLRSTAGTLRAFPTLGRRTFASEVRLDGIEGRIDSLGEELGVLRHQVGDHTETLTGLLRRTTALEHLVEQLHSTLQAADPQAALDIVESVQRNVGALSVQVAEQLNRTSEALAGIADAGDTREAD